MSEVLRAKTKDLLRTRNITGKQRVNSYLNLMELENGSTSLQSKPRRLVLELTSACNLRCVMCGRSAEKFENTFFNYDWLNDLDPILDTVEEVALFGWGEPTVHPRFVDMLEYLAKKDCRKYFVTNGTRLDNIKDAVFDYGVDIIAVSMDGTPKTNDRIRRGTSTMKVLNNIKSYVNEKTKRGRGPYMNIVFTAMRSNIRELPEVVKLAWKAGLDEVKVVYLTAFTDEMSRESLWNHQDLVRYSFDAAAYAADKCKIKIKLPYIQGEDPAKDDAHRTCYMAWRDLFIGSDGFIRPCQSTPEKLFPYGKYRTFDEMWNSPELVDFRYRVNNAGMPEPCSRCYQSSFANWNKVYSWLQMGNDYAPSWNKEKQ